MVVRRFSTRRAAEHMSIYIRNDVRPLSEKIYPLQINQELAWYALVTHVDNSPGDPIAQRKEPLRGW
jgi:hypothetical protein